MSEHGLRVGIVGADTKASWAKVSHVPAVQGLPGLRLAAVATRHEATAREAAEAFGAEHWFADPSEMVRSNAVDLVTVAVRVPAHRELVLAALAAGKAVYCEAPLGRSVAEAEEMAAAAAGRFAAIGLQARRNPAARRAAELIAAGAIGRPLNARVVSTSAGFGPELPAAYDYFNKADSGANLSTITAGHTLDLIEAVLGPVAEVDAREAILWPRVKLIDTGAVAERETADQLAVLGLTRSGCVFTVDVNGGVAPEDVRFVFEVRGSAGWLSLTGGHPYGFQAGDLRLEASAAFDPPEPPAVSGGLMDAAINVGEVYAQLARDLRGGTHHIAGFDHALRNSRLIEAVGRAAESGERQTVAG